MQTATTVISCLTILAFIALIFLSIRNRRASKRRIAQLEALLRTGGSDIRSAESALENLRRQQASRNGFGNTMSNSLSRSRSSGRSNDDLLNQLIITGVLTQDTRNEPVINEMIAAGLFTAESADEAIRASSTQSYNSHDSGFSTGGSYGGGSYSSGSYESSSSSSDYSSSSDSSSSSSCSGGGSD